MQQQKQEQQQPPAQRARPNNPTEPTATTINSTIEHVFADAGLLPSVLAFLPASALASMPSLCRAALHAAAVDVIWRRAALTRWPLAGPMLDAFAARGHSAKAFCRLRVEAARPPAGGASKGGQGKGKGKEEKPKPKPKPKTEEAAAKSQKKGKGKGNGKQGEKEEEDPRAFFHGGFLEVQLLARAATEKKMEKDEKGVAAAACAPLCLASALVPLDAAPAHDAALLDLFGRRPLPLTVHRSLDDVHIGQYRTALTVVLPPGADEGGKPPRVVPLIAQTKYTPYMTQEIMDDEGGIAAFFSVLQASDCAKLAFLQGSVDLHCYQKFNDEDDSSEHSVRAEVRLVPALGRGQMLEPMTFAGALELLRLLEPIVEGEMEKKRG